MNRKLTDMAFCVSTPIVSIVDLTCYLEKAAKSDDTKNVYDNEYSYRNRLDDVMTYLAFKE
ncbi:hypothetical protein A6R68_01594 [Neotoma lepida]|uniref:glyceraldehyde-3-phosphate dehydrogenase (phosphorylating) n=1 Tax=Neotoma lepida TaxID=56216 RepID=A0A1A6GWZ3_NEOLE|nr:hypothetical protein A6R68_01594 [Neotoma lepida]